jgi:hypothetical protein
MELIQFVLRFVVLVLSLIASGARADVAREVKALAEKAANAFAEKGRDYALKLINASAGPFRKKGEL